MVEKLFVLGCPGSGKSTISNYLAMLARDRGWPARPINDYEILYEMFQADTKQEHFRSAAHGGFDVIHLPVYDTALDKLKERVQTLRPIKDELILIEFSRSNYREALSRFGKDFLSDAYFLFLDTDIETCIERVRQRITLPRSIHDHFVPDHVICRHCQEGNRDYVASGLKLDFEIADYKIQILDNRAPIEEVALDVKRFVDTILPVPAGAHTSRNP
jgi:adenylate kinase family enzyme